MSLKRHLGLSIIFALVFSYALAGDDDEKNGDDDEWEYESSSDAVDREIEIEMSDESVEIKATTEKETETNTTESEREDTLEWQIETRNEEGPKGGLEIKFSYAIEQETKTETVETETETELSFRVRVSKIIEFTGTEIYNKSSSTVVQEYMMSSWSPFSKKLTGPNNSIHEFSSSTTDGVMTIVGRISPKAVVDTEDSVAISPNAVKIDIKVADFPWKSDASKLCMVAKLKTKMEVEAEIDEEDEDDDRRRRLGDDDDDDDDDDEDDIKIENPLLAKLRADASTAIPIGKFDWKKTVDGDGKSYAVKTIQKQEKEEDDDDDPAETNYMLYFTFDTGAEVAAPDTSSGAMGMATKTTTTTVTTAAPAPAPSTASAPATNSTTTPSNSSSSPAPAPTSNTSSSPAPAPASTAPAPASNSSSNSSNSSSNSSRRLSGKQVALFVWDPRVGVTMKTYKKPLTMTPRTTTAPAPAPGPASGASGAASGPASGEADEAAGACTAVISLAHLVALALLKAFL